MQPHFLKSAELARARGLPHLEKIFQQLGHSFSDTDPTPVRKRPLICWVYNNEGWCHGRLSRSIAGLMPEFDHIFSADGDFGFLRSHADLYIYRNINRLYAKSVPEWIRLRNIFYWESMRAFDSLTSMGATSVDKHNNLCGLNIAINQSILDTGVSLGAKDVWPVPVGNGVDTAAFSPDFSPRDRFIVGASGNFSNSYCDEWKGFGTYIVPACRQADVPLDWCGWRGIACAIKGAKKQIPLEKMPDWYKSIDCLVSMSKSEGCSGVIWEALASGVPVISSTTGWHWENRIPGIRWIARPERSDRGPVDAACVGEIAKAIADIRDDKLYRTELSLAGRESALEWPHSRVAEIWRGILNQRLAVVRS